MWAGMWAGIGNMQLPGQFDKRKQESFEWTVGSISSHVWGNEPETGPKGAAEIGPKWTAAWLTLARSPTFFRPITR